MTKRLVVPGLRQPLPDGRLLSVTPESAGWSYVGFEAAALAPGQSFACVCGGRELCLVLLSGIADITADGRQWTRVGRRLSVFEPVPPYAVYVPGGGEVRVDAVTAAEIALCWAPAAEAETAAASPRLITPEEIGEEVRGSGTMERHVRNILPETAVAHSLLVVEVITPAGHWSSYPPHKHDRLALPDESLLEETYYYRIDPPSGFALQRIYTDDRELDETVVPRDGDAVLVPRGYHPVAAPPGYDVYYLNVMAGPVRTWKFRNDPQHAWLFAQRAQKTSGEESE